MKKAQVPMLILSHYDSLFDESSSFEVGFNSLDGNDPDAVTNVGIKVRNLLIVILSIFFI